MRLISIPDIQGHEEETLFIIGNGFDQAHKIESSYWHFHEWLMNNGHEEFVKRLEDVYIDKDWDKKLKEKDDQLPLWKDFENELGKINAESAYKALNNEFGDVYMDENAQDSAVLKVRTIVDDVTNLMMKWAKSVIVKRIRRIFNLNSKSKYLTFNYTLTLESQYEIDPIQILHIHGNIKTPKLIVGCGRDVPRPLPENQEQRRYSKKINHEFIRFNKPIDDLIDEQNDFFNSLSGITRVVVLGHSLSEIDEPYFRRVKEKITPDAHWHFSAYSEKDYKNIVEFIQRTLGIYEYSEQKRCYIFNVQLITEQITLVDNKIQVVSPSEVDALDVPKKKSRRPPIEDLYKIHTEIDPNV